MSWIDMLPEELKQELKRFNLNAKELETVKSGKEMIDNAIKLNENESVRAFWALLAYMDYKIREKNNKIQKGE